MGNKKRKPGALKRKKAVRPPNMTMYIVSEGCKTEPAYLREFARDVGNHLVRVEIVDSGGDPKFVVDRAVEVLREKSKEARKERNSFDKKFKVAAIFDRDEHTRLNDALQKARDNEIELGYSNPCFEVWILFHFEPVGGYLHRGDAQSRLQELMPSYHHSKAPCVSYHEIRDKYNEARHRADRALAEREREGCPTGNPSTTIQRVMEHIRKSGLKT